MNIINFFIIFIYLFNSNMDIKSYISDCFNPDINNSYITTFDPSLNYNEYQFIKSYLEMYYMHIAILAKIINGKAKTDIPKLVDNLKLYADEIIFKNLLELYKTNEASKSHIRLFLEKINLSQKSSDLLNRLILIKTNQFDNSSHLTSVEIIPPSIIDEAEKKINQKKTQLDLIYKSKLELYQSSLENFKIAITDANIKDPVILALNNSFEKLKSISSELFATSLKANDTSIQTFNSLKFDENDELFKEGKKLILLLSLTTITEDERSQIFKLILFITLIFHLNEILNDPIFNKNINLITTTSDELNQKNFKVSEEIRALYNKLKDQLNSLNNLKDFSKIKSTFDDIKKDFDILKSYESKTGTDDLKQELTGMIAEISSKIQEKDREISDFQKLLNKILAIINEILTENPESLSSFGISLDNIKSKFDDFQEISLENIKKEEDNFKVELDKIKDDRFKEIIKLIKTILELFQVFTQYQYYISNILNILNAIIKEINDLTEKEKLQLKIGVDQENLRSEITDFNLYKDQIRQLVALLNSYIFNDLSSLTDKLSKIMISFSDDKSLKIEDFEKLYNNVKDQIKDDEIYLGFILNLYEKYKHLLDLTDNFEDAKSIINQIMQIFKGIKELYELKQEILKIKKENDDYINNLIDKEIQKIISELFKDEEVPIFDENIELNKEEFDQEIASFLSLAKFTNLNLDELIKKSDELYKIYDTTNEKDIENKRKIKRKLLEILFRIKKLNEKIIVETQVFNPLVIIELLKQKKNSLLSEIKSNTIIRQSDNPDIEKINSLISQSEQISDDKSYNSDDIDNIEELNVFKEELKTYLEKYKQNPPEYYNDILLLLNAINKLININKEIKDLQASVRKLKTFNDKKQKGKKAIKAITEYAQEKLLEISILTGAYNPNTTTTMGEIIEIKRLIEKKIKELSYSKSEKKFNEIQKVLDIADAKIKEINEKKKKSNDIITEIQKNDTKAQSDEVIIGDITEIPDVKTSDTYISQQHEAVNIARDLKEDVKTLEDGNPEKLKTGSLATLLLTDVDKIDDLKLEEQEIKKEIEKIKTFTDLELKREKEDIDNLDDLLIKINRGLLQISRLTEELKKEMPKIGFEKDFNAFIERQQVLDLDIKKGVSYLEQIILSLNSNQLTDDFSQLKTTYETDIISVSEGLFKNIQDKILNIDVLIVSDTKISQDTDISELINEYLNLDIIKGYPIITKILNYLKQLLETFQFSELEILEHFTPIFYIINLIKNKNKCSEYLQTINSIMDDIENLHIFKGIDLYRKIKKVVSDLIQTKFQEIIDQLNPKLTEIQKLKEDINISIRQLIYEAEILNSSQKIDMSDNNDVKLTLDELLTINNNDLIRETAELIKKGLEFLEKDFFNFEEINKTNLLLLLDTDNNIRLLLSILNLIRKQEKINELLFRLREEDIEKQRIEGEKQQKIEELVSLSSNKKGIIDSKKQEIDQLITDFKTNIDPIKDSYDIQPQIQLFLDIIKRFNEEYETQIYKGIQEDIKDDIQQFIDVLTENNLILQTYVKLLTKEKNLDILLKNASDKLTEIKRKIGEIKEERKKDNIQKLGDLKKIFTDILFESKREALQIKLNSSFETELDKYSREINNFFELLNRQDIKDLKGSPNIDDFIRNKFENIDALILEFKELQKVVDKQLADISELSENNKKFKLDIERISALYSVGGNGNELKEQIDYIISAINNSEITNKIEISKKDLLLQLFNELLNLIENNSLNDNDYQTIQPIILEISKIINDIFEIIEIIKNILNNNREINSKFELVKDKANKAIIIIRKAIDKEKETKTFDIIISDIKNQEQFIINIKDQIDKRINETIISFNDNTTNISGGTINDISNIIDQFRQFSIKKLNLYKENIKKETDRIIKREKSNNYKKLEQLSDNINKKKEEIDVNNRDIDQNKLQITENLRLGKLYIEKAKEIKDNFTIPSDDFLNDIKDKDYLELRAKLPAKLQLLKDIEYLKNYSSQLIDGSKQLFINFIINLLLLILIKGYEIKNLFEINQKKSEKNIEIEKKANEDIQIVQSVIAEISSINEDIVLITDEISSVVEEISQPSLVSEVPVAVPVAAAAIPIISDELSEDNIKLKIEEFKSKYDDKYSSVTNIISSLITSNEKYKLEINTIESLISSINNITTNIYENIKKIDTTSQLRNITGEIKTGFFIDKDENKEKITERELLNFILLYQRYINDTGSSLSSNEKSKFRILLNILTQLIISFNEIDKINLEEIKTKVENENKINDLLNQLKQEIKIKELLDKIFNFNEKINKNYDLISNIIDALNIIKSNSDIDFKTIFDLFNKIQIEKTKINDIYLQSINIQQSQETDEILSIDLFISKINDNQTIKQLLEDIKKLLNQDNNDVLIIIKTLIDIYLLKINDIILETENYPDLIKEEIIKFFKELAEKQKTKIKSNIDQLQATFNSDITKSKGLYLQSKEKFENIKTIIREIEGRKELSDNEVLIQKSNEIRSLVFANFKIIKEKNRLILQTELDFNNVKLDENFSDIDELLNNPFFKKLTTDEIKTFILLIEIIIKNLTTIDMTFFNEILKIANFYFQLLSKKTLEDISEYSTIISDNNDIISNLLSQIKTEENDKINGLFLITNQSLNSKKDEIQRQLDDILSQTSENLKFIKDNNGNERLGILSIDINSDDIDDLLTELRTYTEFNEIIKIIDELLELCNNSFANEKSINSSKSNIKTILNLLKIFKEHKINAEIILKEKQNVETKIEEKRKADENINKAQVIKENIKLSILQFKETLNDPITKNNDLFISKSAELLRLLSDMSDNIPENISNNKREIDELLKRFKETNQLIVLKSNDIPSILDDQLITSINIDDIQRDFEKLKSLNKDYNIINDIISKINELLESDITIDIIKNIINIILKSGLLLIEILELLKEINDNYKIDLTRLFEEINKNKEEFIIAMKKKEIKRRKDFLLSIIDNGNKKLDNTILTINKSLNDITSNISKDFKSNDELFKQLDRTTDIDISDINNLIEKIKSELSKIPTDIIKKDNIDLNQDPNSIFGTLKQDIDNIFGSSISNIKDLFELIELLKLNLKETNDFISNSGINDENLDDSQIKQMIAIIGDIIISFINKINFLIDIINENKNLFQTINRIKIEIDKKLALKSGKTKFKKVVRILKSVKGLSDEGEARKEKRELIDNNIDILLSQITNFDFNYKDKIDELSELINKIDDIISILEIPNFKIDDIQTIKQNKTDIIGKETEINKLILEINELISKISNNTHQLPSNFDRSQVIQEIRQLTKMSSISSVLDNIQDFVGDDYDIFLDLLKLIIIKFNELNKIKEEINQLISITKLSSITINQDIILEENKKLEKEKDEKTKKAKELGSKFQNDDISIFINQLDEIKGGVGEIISKEECINKIRNLELEINKVNYPLFYNIIFVLNKIIDDIDISVIVNIINTIDNTIKVMIIMNKILKLVEIIKLKNKINDYKSDLLSSLNIPDINDIEIKFTDINTKILKVNSIIDNSLDIYLNQLRQLNNDITINKNDIENDINKLSELSENSEIINNEGIIIDENNEIIKAVNNKPINIKNFGFNVIKLEIIIKKKIELLNSLISDFNSKNDNLKSNLLVTSINTKIDENNQNILSLINTFVISTFNNINTIDNNLLIIDSLITDIEYFNAQINVAKKEINDKKDFSLSQKLEIEVIIQDLLLIPNINTFEFIQQQIQDANSNISKIEKENYRYILEKLIKYATLILVISQDNSDLLLIANKLASIIIKLFNINDKINNIQLNITEIDKKTKEIKAKKEQMEIDKIKGEINKIKVDIDKGLSNNNTYITTISKLIDDLFKRENINPIFDIFDIKNGFIRDIDANKDKILIFIDKINKALKMEENTFRSIEKIDKSNLKQEIDDNNDKNNRQITYYEELIVLIDTNKTRIGEPLATETKNYIIEQHIEKLKLNKINSLIADEDSSSIINTPVIKIDANKNKDDYENLLKIVFHNIDNSNLNIIIDRIKDELNKNSDLIKTIKTYDSFSSIDIDDYIQKWNSINEIKENSDHLFEFENARRTKNIANNILETAINIYKFAKKIFDLIIKIKNSFNDIQRLNFPDNSEKPTIQLSLNQALNQFKFLGQIGINFANIANDLNELSKNTFIIANDIEKVEKTLKDSELLITSSKNNLLKLDIAVANKIIYALILKEIIKHKDNSNIKDIYLPIIIDFLFKIKEFIINIFKNNNELDVTIIFNLIQDFNTNINNKPKNDFKIKDDLYKKIRAILEAYADSFSLGKRALTGIFEFNFGAMIETQDEPFKPYLVKIRDEGSIIRSLSEKIKDKFKDKIKITKETLETEDNNQFIHIANTISSILGQIDKELIEFFKAIISGGGDININLLNLLRIHLLNKIIESNNTDITNICNEISDFNKSFIEIVA